MKKAIVNAALVITSVLVISCSSGSAGGDDSTGGTTDLAEVTELRIYNWGDRSVTLAWKDPAGVNLAHVEITSPSLTAAVKAAKGAERGVVTLPKNNVIYTLTVQAVDTNQNKTAGKTLMVLSEAPLNE